MNTIINSLKDVSKVMSLDTITQRFEDYKVISDQKSTYSNLLAMRYNVNTSIASLERTESFIEMIDLFTNIGHSNVGDESITYDQMVDVLTQAFADKDFDTWVSNEEHSLTILDITGQPCVFKAKRIENSYDETSEFQVTQGSASDWYMRFIYHPQTETFTEYYHGGTLKRQNGVAVTTEELLDNITAEGESQSVIQYIINNIPTVGTRDTASIIAALQNMDSDIARKAALLLGQMKDISLSTGIALVSQLLLFSSSAQYTEGNSFYTPLEIPGYNTNFLGVLVGSLLQVLGTVLVALFRFIGAVAVVLGAVLSAVGTLLSRITGRSFSTTVTDISALPTFNYPMSEGIELTYDELVTFVDNTTYMNLILDELRETGCAGIVINKICSILVLPRAIDDDGNFTSFFIQVVGNCTAPIVSTPTIGWAETHQSTFGDSVAIRFRTPDDSHIGCSFIAADDYDSKYLSMSDDERRTAAFIAWIQAAQLCNRPFVSASFPGLVWSAAQYAPQASISMSGWVNQVNGIVKLLSADEEITNTTDILFYKICSTVAFFNLHNIAGDWSATAGKTPGWDELVIMYKWLIEYLKTPTDVTIEWYSIAGILEITPGLMLLQPNVLFPTDSAQALIRQTLLVVATTAAIMTAATVVGAKLRRRAIAKNVLRQQQYDQTKKEYVEKVITNPDDYTVAAKQAITRDLYNANKRLGRSWWWAGFVGVRSINGFTTGSTSSSPASGLGDKFNKINQFVNDTMAGESITSVKQNDKSDVIIDLLAGDIPH